MSEAQRRTLLAFLRRTPLRGEEARAYLQIFDLINTANPDPEPMPRPQPVDRPPQKETQ